MIRYALRCENGHGFESWFRDSQAFDALSRSGNVSCPHCASTAVEKSLMTPRLGRAQAEAAVATPAEAPPPPQQRTLVPQAEQVRALLQQLRRTVEENCDYVGDDFAEQARRIYYGEAEARGIYGETTPEDAEALVEEGVEFARIPWLPHEDA
ncbi:MAG TPA: DUF1178 family protein [Kiloniellales bacterium]|nr:DUF1178 family protein [Kiloniellales bacterium]